MSRPFHGRPASLVPLLVSVFVPLGMMTTLSCGEYELDIGVNLITTSCPDGDGEVDDALAHASHLEFVISGDGLSEPLISTASVEDGSAVIPGIPLAGLEPQTRLRIDVNARTGRGPHDPIQARGGAVVSLDESMTAIEVPIFLRRLDRFNYTASVHEPETCSVMNQARSGHTATSLMDGRVLIVGGSLNDSQGRSVHASAELFDPRTGEFQLLQGDAGPSQHRVFHTATLLRDGRVLVAGGERYLPGGSLRANRCAEIFDPATDTFGTPIDMTRARTRHTATAVAGDIVVLAGGYLDPTPPTDGDHPHPTETTELFFANDNGGKGAFEAGLDLPFARAEHCAVSTSSGGILVLAGGKTLNGSDVEVAGTVRYLRVRSEERVVEVLGQQRGYDMRIGRHGLVCGVTRNHRDVEQIVIAGGFRRVFGPDEGVGEDDITANVELFDSQSPQSLGDMPGGARGWLCAAQLGNVVAFMGGVGNDALPRSTADLLLQEDTGPSLQLVQGRMKDGRIHHQCTSLLDGSILVTGGEYQGEADVEQMHEGGGRYSLDTVEIYTPRRLQ